jgi:hypothetical protein
VVKPKTTKEISLLPVILASVLEKAMTRKACADPLVITIGTEDLCKNQMRTLKGFKQPSAHNFKKQKQ